MKLLIPLILLFPLVSFAAESFSERIAPRENYTTTWAWESGGRYSSFIIKIKRSGNLITGNYCANIDSGSKIDCFKNSKPSFKFMDTGKASYIIKFMSGHGFYGKAILDINKDQKLIWKIIKLPKGKCYAPKQAILITL